MTMRETSARYQIPVKILKMYESWGLRGGAQSAMEARQYDDTDLERLSLIMTLCDVGFTSREAETYMRLLVDREDSVSERLRMLDRRREEALEDIHFRERQLERLDFLRHELRRKRDP